MLYLQCFIVLMFKIFWIILRSGLKISPPFFILLWGILMGGCSVPLTLLLNLSWISG